MNSASTTPPLPFMIQPVQDTEADHLLSLSDAYMDSLYPPESNHLVSPDSLRQNALVFLGGFIGPDCIACVALMAGHKPHYAEVKRLFILNAYRGRGYAKQMITALEQAARQQEISCLQLETGIYQPASHALYHALGYQKVPPFGDYQTDPLSVFFEKHLG